MWKCRGLLSWRETGLIWAYVGWLLGGIGWRALRPAGYTAWREAYASLRRIGGVLLLPYNKFHVALLAGWGWQACSGPGSGAHTLVGTAALAALLLLISKGACLLVVAAGCRLRLPEHALLQALLMRLVMAGNRDTCAALDAPAGSARGELLGSIFGALSTLLLVIPLPVQLAIGTLTPKDQCNVSDSRLQWPARWPMRLWHYCVPCSVPRVRHAPVLANPQPYHAPPGSRPSLPPCRCRRSSWTLPPSS